MNILLTIDNKLYKLSAAGKQKKEKEVIILCIT